MATPAFHRLLGTPLGPLWDPLGTPWGSLGAPWDPLGTPGDKLRCLQPGVALQGQFFLKILTFSGFCGLSKTVFKGSGPG